MKKNKSRLEYALCLSLSVLYLVFLDGRTGMFILAAFIAAPLISAAMAYYAKEKISIAVSARADVVKKGEISSFDVVFSTRALLPTPFILVTLFSDEHLGAENDEYRLTIRPKSSRTVSEQIIGSICGEGKAGVLKVEMTDYLGLLSFTLYEEKGLGEYSAFVGVTPNVPDTALKNALIQSVSSVTAAEETEETEENTSLVFGGNPGYEHREYIPGDPIKRINWKLSTKRDSLMVRLDEGVAEAKQFALLDFAFDTDETDNEEKLLNEERLIEGLLGFALTLSKLGKELVFYTLVNKSWQQLSIKTPDDVAELQFSFSHFVFHDNSYALRIPSQLLNKEVKASALTIFTNFPDSQLCSYIDTLSHGGTVCYTAVSKPVSSGADNIWLIGDDYSFGRYS